MIFELLYNALTTTLCFSNAITEKLKLVHIAFLFIFNFMFTYFLNGTPYMIVVIISFNLLNVLFCTQNKAINGIASLLGYITSVALNNLTLVLLQKLFDIDVITLISNKKFYVIFCSIFLIVVFVVTTIIRLLLKKFVIKSILSNSSSTLVLIFIELLLCAAILIFNITYARQIGYPQNTILFNCLLFLVYFVLSTLLLIGIVKSTRANLLMQHQLKEQEQLQEYTKQIELQAEQMRSFKHDYINMLFTLDIMIQESKHEPLIEYFNENIKPSGDYLKYINTNMVALQHIKNSGIKSLLYNKLSYALSLNFDLNLYLNFDILDFGINSMDVAKLLGIFLDNAIEAASCTTHPKLSVVFTNENGITIEISNNFYGEKPDLNKITEKGYSTKGKNRGLGLNHAQQILDKNPSIAHKVNVSDDTFTQAITFVPMT